MNNKVIYLDNQATTPVDPRVLDAMRPYFSDEYGNPHSTGHAYGWCADAAVGQAREHAARLLGADAREIIFTSGATESCNLALRGVAKAHAGNTARRKIITSAIEHPCVLETCEDLKQDGWDVVVIGAGPDGLVNLDELRTAVDEQTLLVSIMTVNNEIGVIQPMEEIGKICAAAGACLHTDAAQAAGKTPIDVKKWGTALLSLSAHKMYGPKGVGALYLRWKPAVPIKPLFSGGGQERGIRPGTVPVAQAVGLGEACRIAAERQDEDAAKIRELTDKLRGRLLEICPDAVLFGHPDQRVPGNISIGFPGYAGEEIVAALGERIAMSTGSACSSVKSEPSHVLLAIGAGEAMAQSAIRLSVGRFNTREDIDGAAQALSELFGVARAA